MPISADVMRTDGVSSTYPDAQRLRPAFPPASLASSWRPASADSDPAQAATAAAARHSVASAAHASVECQLAVERRRPARPAGEVSPWATLEPNYIAALLRRAAHRAVDERAAGSELAPDTTTSLLQTLLRHAFLRDSPRAAALLQANELAPTSRPRCATRSSSISSPARRRRAALEAAARTDARGDRRRHDSQLPRKPDQLHDARSRALGEFRSSLADLKDLDSEALVAADARARSTSRRIASTRG